MICMHQTDFCKVSSLNFVKYCSASTAAVFKVGGVVPLEMILRDKGSNKTKGVIGDKTTQRGKNVQALPPIEH